MSEPSSVPNGAIDEIRSSTTSAVTIEKVVSHLVPLKLRHENYFVWKLLFEALLRRCKLTGIVNGSEPCPPPFLTDKDGKLSDEVNPAFAIWHDKNETVMAWMNSTLSEQVRPFTAGVTSSHEIWVNLEKRFQVAGVSSEYRRNLAVAALATADVCDANAALFASGDLRLLPPIFQMYGKWRAFSGPIVTLKLFEDNTLVVEALATKGEGRVLVIDGEGSMRRAVTGEKLVRCAVFMGWSGIVVNGCIRDVEEINGCEIGVRALATCPVKPIRNGGGQKHVPICIGGTWIRDGEWLYADGDGILVSATKLSI